MYLGTYLRQTMLTQITTKARIDTYHTMNAVPEHSLTHSLAADERVRLWVSSSRKEKAQHGCRKGEMPTKEKNNNNNRVIAPLCPSIPSSYARLLSFHFCNEQAIDALVERVRPQS